MQVKKHNRFLWLIIGVVFTLHSFANPPKNGRVSYTRFGIAPVIGFYGLQSKHALSPKSRMSLAFFIKREKSIDRANKTFFSYGLEYFFHGLNYKSYYFDQDTLQLYDNSFAFNYSLSMHEVQLPLQVKFAFNSTTNSLFSPYVTVGYHLRYLAANSLKVTQDGNLKQSDNVNMKFKNPFILSKLNSAIGVSVGFQSNKMRSSATTFFMEASFKYGFSPYYFKQNYSANAVYINSMHLTLNIGIGF